MTQILKTEIEKVDFTYTPETEEYEYDMLTKCGEIFIQSRRQNELFIFFCALCDKKFNTIMKYSNHIENEHLVLESEYLEANRGTIQDVPKATAAAYDSYIDDMQELFEFESDGTCKAENDNPPNLHNTDEEYENLIETESEDDTCENPEFVVPYESSRESSLAIQLLNADKINEVRSIIKVKRKCHTIQELHQCTKCSKSFKRKSNLKTHELSHQQIKPFACKTCSATFANKQNLVIHERRHAGEKPFHCSFCDKSFVSSTECNSHLRSHTGERPYICEDCGKGHTTSSQLMQHRKQHTGERRYTCDKCQKSFRTSTHLRTHINAVHANLPRSFRCTQCEANFKTSLALNQHSKIHSQEKRYKCRFCSKAFAQHPGLYAHIKTHEKNDALITNPT